MALEDWEFGTEEFFRDFSPSLNEILGLTIDSDGPMDQHAQDLMVSAIMDKNDSAYAELVDYMWDEYGIDFEEEWDWEDFSDWYNSQ